MLKFETGSRIGLMNDILQQALLCDRKAEMTVALRLPRFPGLVYSLEDVNVEI